MEGIITGIGDKQLGKNLIKPEYDAVINDFIVGKHTILEGLQLNGNILSAGTCILCGYRGIIDTPKELDTTAYVYGEFILNSIYGGSGEDDFNIVTSDTALNEIEYKVNPTEITSAGTYYLLLYENGEKKVDFVEENGVQKQVGEYPLKSYYSTETENVLDKAVIAPTATTPTETKTITNELGEEETVIATDLHDEYPNRVSNTEYVHAQIKREVDYGILTMNLVAEYKGLDLFENIGTITIERKARYCIGYIELDLSKLSVAMMDSSLYTFYGDKNLTGFLPVNDTVFTIILSSDAITSVRRICVMGTENGRIKEKWSIKENGNGWAETSFGYQCQSIK